MSCVDSLETTDLYGLYQQIADSLEISRILVRSPMLICGQEILAARSVMSLLNLRADLESQYARIHPFRNLVHQRFRIVSCIMSWQTLETLILRLVSGMRFSEPHAVLIFPHSSIAVSVCSGSRTTRARVYQNAILVKRSYSMISLLS